MFSTLGVTRTPITLLGSRGRVGTGEVIVDGVAVEGSDVASVDGVDGSSVEGGGVQASVVVPAQETLFV